MRKGEWEDQFNEYKTVLLGLVRMYGQPNAVGYADFNRDVSRKKIEGYDVVNFGWTREQAGVRSNLDFAHVARGMASETRREIPIGKSDHYAFLTRLGNLKPMRRRRYKTFNRRLLIEIAGEAYRRASTPRAFFELFDSMTLERKSEIVWLNKTPPLSSIKKGHFRSLSGLLT